MKLKRYKHIQEQYIVLLYSRSKERLRLDCDITATSSKRRRMLWVIQQRKHLTRAKPYAKAAVGEKW